MAVGEAWICTGQARTRASCIIRAPVDPCPRAACRGPDVNRPANRPDAASKRTAEPAPAAVHRARIDAWGIAGCPPWTSTRIAPMRHRGRAARLVLAGRIAGNGRRGGGRRTWSRPDAGRMPRGLELLADCGVDPNRRMPPLDAGALDIVGDLAGAVPGLGTADGIILARAPADPYSVFLVAGGHALAGNAAIDSARKRQESGDGETPRSKPSIRSKHAAPFDLVERVVYGLAAAPCDLF